MSEPLKVLIIEDETAAAANLKALLSSTFPEIEVVGELETVTDAVRWFEGNNAVDLVFMDIHLADGDAFMIFERVGVDAPIVFTTAYDQYALDAFKVNSIDYLLKPLKADDLRRAVDKLAKFTNSDKLNYTQRVARMAHLTQNRPKVLLAHVRDRIVPIKVEEIAYFHSSNEKVTLRRLDGELYPIDKTLEALAAILPEERFFRANRQFIISRDCIRDISVWFGSRLSVNATVELPEKIIISKAKVSEFKRWISGAGND